MRAKLFTPAGAFFFLSIAAFAYFVLTLVRVIKGDAEAGRGFTDGLGIEIIGAIVTSLGVIGLERLYTDPNTELTALRERIDEQSAKIDAMQAELRRLTTTLDTHEETTSQSNAPNDTAP